MSDDAADRKLRLLALGLAEMQKRLSNLSREVRDWEFGGNVTITKLADNTRGVAGKPGRVIFNTDDGQLNIDDGTNWTLPDGTTT